MNDINLLTQIQSKNHLSNASIPHAPRNGKEGIGYNQSYPPGFEFNADLDVAFLIFFYQGDLEQAAQMFDIFLNVTAKEFTNLAGLVRQKDWNAFRQLAHKMKPNFRIVGLTKLSNLLGKLENWDEATSEKEELSSLLNAIHIAFKKYLPIVVNERRRIGFALAEAV